MNLLIDSLPQEVVIDGRAYSVYTDFRNWIRFELTVLNEDMDLQKRAAELLTLCYQKDLPPSFQDAIDAAILFYSGNEEWQSGKNNREMQEGAGGKSPVYSFAYDADYIYSAFYTQYGIDLTTAKLHWYQFKALFRSLNDTNQIVKIMEYRSMDLSKIKDKQQRSFYRRMKKIYQLPHSKTEQEKVRQIEQALLNGGDLTGIL